MDLLQGATAVLAAYGDEAQGQRLLRMTFPHGDGPDSIMLANSIRVDEAMSRDFQVEVEVLSDDALIALDDVTGRMVTISLVRDDGTLRYFNGYVFAFRFVKTDGGFAFYQMELKPWLAFLRLRQDCRVFQRLNLTELCDEVFLDYLERDCQYRLLAEPPELTLAIQYNESDHNHLHRRLEAAGLVYWYEHRADGHTLIISDDSTHCAPVDGTGDMPYQNQAGAREDDGIGQWAPARRVSPGKVTLTSYNFKNARAARSERPSLTRSAIGRAPACHDVLAGRYPEPVRRYTPGMGLRLGDGAPVPGATKGERYHGYVNVISWHSLVKAPWHEVKGAGAVERVHCPEFVATHRQRRRATAAA